MYDIEDCLSEIAFKSEATINKDKTELAELYFVTVDADSKAEAKDLVANAETLTLYSDGIALYSSGKGGLTFVVQASSTEDAEAKVRGSVTGESEEVKESIKITARKMISEAKVGDKDGYFFLTVDADKDTEASLREKAKDLKPEVEKIQLSDADKQNVTFIVNNDTLVGAKDVLSKWLAKSGMKDPKFSAEKAGFYFTIDGDDAELKELKDAALKLNLQRDKMVVDTKSPESKTKLIIKVVMQDSADEAAAIEILRKWVEKTGLKLESIKISSSTIEEAKQAPKGKVAAKESQADADTHSDQDNNENDRRAKDDSVAGLLDADEENDSGRKITPRDIDALITRFLRSHPRWVVLSDNNPYSTVDPMKNRRFTNRVALVRILSQKLPIDKAIRRGHVAFIIYLYKNSGKVAYAATADGESYFVEPVMVRPIDGVKAAIDLSGLKDLIKNLSADELSKSTELRGIGGKVIKADKKEEVTETSGEILEEAIIDTVDAQLARKVRGKWLLKNVDPQSLTNVSLKALGTDKTFARKQTKAWVVIPKMAEKMPIDRAIKMNKAKAVVFARKDKSKVLYSINDGKAWSAIGEDGVAVRDAVAAVHNSLKAGTLAEAVEFALEGVTPVTEAQIVLVDKGDLIPWHVAIQVSGNEASRAHKEAMTSAGQQYMNLNQIKYHGKAIGGIIDLTILARSRDQAHQAAQDWLEAVGLAPASESIKVEAKEIKKVKIKKTGETGDIEATSANGYVVVKTKKGPMAFKADEVEMMAESAEVVEESIPENIKGLFDYFGVKNTNELHNSEKFKELVGGLEEPVIGYATQVDGKEPLILITGENGKPTGMIGMSWKDGQLWPMHSTLVTKLESVLEGATMIAEAALATGESKPVSNESEQGSINQAFHRLLKTPQDTIAIIPKKIEAFVKKHKFSADQIRKGLLYVLGTDKRKEVERLMAKYWDYLFDDEHGHQRFVAEDKISKAAGDQPETLKNSKTVVEYIPKEKVIRGDDLTDENNLPAFYTKSKRGLEKAWLELAKAWTEDMTMYQAAEVLGKNGIDYRSYCRMD